MGMKYLYTVVPRKRLVIPGLAAPIYSRKSIKLNEKEVELCLKAGSVYRRFNADTIIKVTPSTIARYHTEKFMNDEEYEKYLKSLNDKSAHTGMVVDTDVTPKEEVADDTTPADEESGKEESTTVDEIKPEETAVQNNREVINSNRSNHKHNKK